jgi:hypothetical protein
VKDWTLTSAYDGFGLSCEGRRVRHVANRTAKKYGPRFMRVWKRPPTIEIGRFHLQIGGASMKKGPFWIPDGLFVWWGAVGVSAFWSGSPYQRRISLMRDEEPPVIPDPPRRLSTTP